MKTETVEFLIKNLKDDHIIKQKSFTSDKINKESVEKTRIKIKKRFKTMRWLIAITLILILATFIYLSFTEGPITKLGKSFIQFWYIFMGAFISSTFASREIWNSRKNLLILDLFEKEILK